MKLQQLRYILEVRNNQFSISNAAERLFTSQPGVSKQVGQLETELGTAIFTRYGKLLTGLTPAGEKIMERSEDILERVDRIRETARKYRKEGTGQLEIATTHSQARYVLPSPIQSFIQKYPNIRLTIHQGTPSHIAEMVHRNQADLAIATEGCDLFDHLIKLPYYQWNRICLVPGGHPLTRASELTLESLAEYPIITYTAGFSGRAQIDQTFESHGIRPDIVLTATDADVIKTYVRLGLGVGIVAHMAYLESDNDLVPIDAAHLFEMSTTRILIRREPQLQGYLHDFIETLAPHLTKESIEKAQLMRDPKDQKSLFSRLKLPIY